MKVLRFLMPSLGREAVGVLIDEGVLNFTEAHQAKELFDKGNCSYPMHSPLDLMEAGLFRPEVFQDVIDFARRHHLTERFLVPDYRILSPIALPSKIIALGRNYVAHAKELGHEVPTEPVYFGKLNSSVIGPEEPVVYKKGLTRVDHEVELAVIIGKRCSNVSESDAYSYVAGYTILNDVTARDMQTEDLKTANPWTRSKGIDTFCPIGPWIVLPDEIPDPNVLDLEMRVNGKVRQKDNTSNMLFKVPEIIACISRLHTLLPGDIIPTGTPEGIGPVNPGDIMECIVERIGTLRNPVIAE